MKSITFLTCTAVISVGSITATTYAGGFGTAQFGGAHGTAASESLTSIFYNPAGLALGDGTRAYVEALAAYRTADYVRDPGDIDHPNVTQDAIDANSGAGKLRNTLVSPFAAIASDLGHRGLAVAVGVYVPFGGQAEWSQVDRWKGNQDFPGAVDGPQRWSVTSGKQQSIFYTGAVAYRTRDNRLSFGLGVNVIQSALQLTRARNITGTDDLHNPDGSVSEGRSLIDVSEVEVSAGLGIVAQLDEHSKVGVSYQTQPLGGEQKLDGTLINKFGASGITTQQVEFRQRLPDSVRAAYEWQGRTHAFRGGVDWTHWSVYKDQCLVDATMPTSCQFLASGAWDTEAEGTSPLLEIRRDWHDSYGIQGGASWWPQSTLELSANLRLDTNAVPDSTLEPALMDANKVIGMVGARLSRGPIDFDLTLAYAAYEKRTTNRGPTLDAPSRNPDMAGSFEQSVAFVLFGIGVHR